MPLIKNRVSIPGASVNENVIAGSAFEYLPGAAVIDVGLVQIDGAAGDCVADISSGADILAESMGLTLRANGINVQDDVYMQDVAAAGDRLKLRVRNTNAAARIVEYFVRMTPLG